MFATWLGTPRPSPAVSARRLKISRGRFQTSVSRAFANSGVAAASQPLSLETGKEETLCWVSFFHDTFKHKRKRRADVQRNNSVPQLATADRQDVVLRMYVRYGKYVRSKCYDRTS